jgi:hypothetical protein
MRLIIAAIMLTSLAQNEVVAQESADMKTVRAFLDGHCVRCHGDTKPKGNVSLRKLTTPKKGGEDLDHWNKIFDQVEAQQMPPLDAAQPSRTERQAAVASLKLALKAAGVKIDELKLLAPARGNWVDHDALFASAAIGESGTPARVWRISAKSYAQFFKRLEDQFGAALADENGVSSPWGSSLQWDFTDYASTHRVSSAEMEHHLRNCTVTAKRLSPRLKSPNGPIKKAAALFSAGKAATPEQADAAVRDTFEVLFHLTLEPAALKAYSDQVTKNVQAYGSEMAVERLLISALFYREAIYRIEEPEEGGVRRGIMAPRHLARAISMTLTDREEGGERRWDTHGNNFKALKHELLPSFDIGLSAFFDDLEARGMLDDVLVLVWGEFGRTPRINNNAGRDHYAPAASALLFGGGLKVGQVIGSTTRYGERPLDRPIHYQQMFATLYRHLGIDPARATVLDPNNRPQYLLEHTDLIRELVG